MTRIRKTKRRTRRTETGRTAREPHQTLRKEAGISCARYVRKHVVSFFLAISRVMLFNTHLVDSFHLPANISGTQLQKVTNGQKCPSECPANGLGPASAGMAMPIWRKLLQRALTSCPAALYMTILDIPARPLLGLLKKKGRPKVHSETQKLLCGREVSNKKNKQIKQKL